MRQNTLLEAQPYPVEQALQKLGANLRKARLRRHLTIDDAAEKIGTGPRAVSDAERGKASTGIAVYAALLWAYDSCFELLKISPIRSRINRGWHSPAAMIGCARAAAEDSTMTSSRPQGPPGRALVFQHSYASQSRRRNPGTHYPDQLIWRFSPTSSKIERGLSRVRDAEHWISGRRKGRASCSNFGQPL